MGKPTAVITIEVENKVPHKKEFSFKIEQEQMTGKKWKI